MQPSYKNGNVISRCPDCGGAVTTFEHRGSHGEYGAIIIEQSHQYTNASFGRVLYIMMRCAGCGRAGLSKIHDNGKVYDGVLEQFFPFSVESARIPANTPPGIASEFREAELCASFAACRAASALFRSTLEKALKANGYAEGSLAARVDQAAKDGVITEARRKRAHEDIRVLGNDVLHDEWRVVTPDEVDLAHHYVQRILEDLYDDRSSVEAILIAAKRVPEPKKEDK